MSEHKVCKFCGVESYEKISVFANHVRWCKLNPERGTCKSGSRKPDSEETKIKRALGIKKAYVDGKYKDAAWNNVGRPHTKESKEKISRAALASNHRRLVRSVRDYVKLDGTIVKLDSSWETELATRLDYLSIDWVRPELPLLYVDNTGKNRKYFPDFYLTGYDLYLDPKNPYAFKVQRDKIDILNRMYSNIIWIKSLDECRNFVV